MRFSLYGEHAYIHFKHTDILADNPALPVSFIIPNFYYTEKGTTCNYSVVSLKFYLGIFKCPDKQLLRCHLNIVACPKTVVSLDSVHLYRKCSLCTTFG